MASRSVPDHEEDTQPVPAPEAGEVDVIPGRLASLIRILRGGRSREQLRQKVRDRIPQEAGGDSPVRATMNAICDEGGPRAKRYVRAICEELSVPLELVLVDCVGLFERRGLVWDDHIRTQQEVIAYCDRANAILAAVEGAPPVPAWTTEFDSYIEEKAADFVGRRKLIEEIRAFLDPARNTVGCGYFVIEASPGLGKTALLAKLVHDPAIIPEHSWAAHHFNRRAIGLVSREAFLANICTRLTLLHGAPHRPLPENLGDSRYFVEYLDHITRQPGFDPVHRPVLIAIDALDEAEHPLDGENTLGLPDRLPKGVFVIATARRTLPGYRGEGNTYRLRVPGEHTPKKTAAIRAEDLANLGDIAEFIDSQARLPELEPILLRPEWQRYLSRQSSAASTASEQFVKFVAARAGGNFMVASQLLREIAKGLNGRFGDPETAEWQQLPSGLRDYYQLHWEMMLSRAGPHWVGLHYPVIGALVLYRRPADIDMIFQFVVACMPAVRVAEMHNDPAARLAKTQEIRGALEDFGQFLEVSGPPERPCYALYHPRFAEFLEGNPDLCLPELRQLFIDRCEKPPEIVGNEQMGTGP